MADIHLEQIRVKNLQGVVAPPLFKPILPGIANPMCSIIRIHNETERLTTKSARIFDQEATKALADLDKLSDERCTELRKEAESARSRATWGTLSTIAQYITGVGSVLLGTSLTAVPGGFVPGAMLIASGVIGLGTRTLHDTGLLESAVAWFTKSEELQKNIAHKIEMGAFFLEMGLGLAGGVGAWRSGAFAAARINGSITQKTLSSMLTGANQTLSITGRFGQSHYQRKIAYSQARLKELETRKFISDQELQQDTKQLSKMIESTQSQTDQAHKAIRALEVSLD